MNDELPLCQSQIILFDNLDGFRLTEPIPPFLPPIEGLLIRDLFRGPLFRPHLDDIWTVGLALVHRDLLQNLQKVIICEI